MSEHTTVVLMSDDELEALTFIARERGIEMIRSTKTRDRHPCTRCNGTGFLLYAQPPISRTLTHGRTLEELVNAAVVMGWNR